MKRKATLVKPVRDKKVLNVGQSILLVSTFERKGIFYYICLFIYAMEMIEE